MSGRTPLPPLSLQGFGRYTRIPTSALPPLFLAWAADPSDSGRIHAPVKQVRLGRTPRCGRPCATLAPSLPLASVQRWLAGDPEIVASMTAVGEVADAGHALAQGEGEGAGGVFGAGAPMAATEGAP